MAKDLVYPDETLLSTNEEHLLGLMGFSDVYDGYIQTKQTRIEEIESQVQLKQSQLDDLEAELQENRTKRRRIRSAQNEFKQSVSDITQEIDELEKEKQQTEERVTSITGEQDLQKQLSIRLNKLDKQIETTKERIRSRIRTTHRKKIDELQREIRSIEDEMSGHDDQLDSLVKQINQQSQPLGTIIQQSTMDVADFAGIEHSIAKQARYNEDEIVRNADTIGVDTVELEKFAKSRDRRLFSDIENEAPLLSVHEKAMTFARLVAEVGDELQDYATDVQPKRSEIASLEESIKQEKQEKRKRLRKSRKETVDEEKTTLVQQKENLALVEKKVDKDIRRKSFEQLFKQNKIHRTANRVAEITEGNELAEKIRSYAKKQEDLLRISRQISRLRREKRQQRDEDYRNKMGVVKREIRTGKRKANEIKDKLAELETEKDALETEINSLREAKAQSDSVSPVETDKIELMCEKLLPTVSGDMTTRFARYTNKTNAQRDNRVSGLLNKYADTGDIETAVEQVRTEYSD